MNAEQFALILAELKQREGLQPLGSLVVSGILEDLWSEIAEAERRGAVKALREAAADVSNLLLVNADAIEEGRE